MSTKFPVQPTTSQKNQLSNKLKPITQKTTPHKVAIQVNQTKIPNNNKYKSVTTTKTPSNIKSTKENKQQQTAKWCVKSTINKSTIKSQTQKQTKSPTQPQNLETH